MYFFAVFQTWPDLSDLCDSDPERKTRFELATLSLEG